MIKGVYRLKLAEIYNSLEDNPRKGVYAYNLFLMYSEGKLIEPDYIYAIFWYMVSANHSKMRREALATYYEQFEIHKSFLWSIDTKFSSNKPSEENIENDIVESIIFFIKHLSSYEGHVPTERYDNWYYQVIPRCHFKTEIIEREYRNVRNQIYKILYPSYMGGAMPGQIISDEEENNRIQEYIHKYPNRVAKIRGRERTKMQNNIQNQEIKDKVILDKNMELLIKKFNAGNSQAACEIGWKYEQDGDLQSAKEWYLQGVVKGNQSAAVLLNNLKEKESKQRHEYRVLYDEIDPSSDYVWHQARLAKLFESEYEGLLSSRSSLKGFIEDNYRRKDRYIIKNVHIEPM